MRLLLVFARSYPRRTLLTMLCLLLAALADGLGVSSILPLMRLATPGAAAPAMGSRGSTALEERVLALFHAIGLDPTMRTLFALALAGMLLKALLLLVANRQVGYTVAHMATTLRLDLIRALLTTRWQHYVHQPISVVANAFALEADRAAEAYLRATTILAFVVQAVVYTAIACMVSWPAAAVALVGGAAIVTVLSRLVRMARRAGARQTKLMRALLARFTDTLQSVKALKAMAREPLIAPVLEGETQRLNRALQREVISTAAMDSLQEPLIFLFLATALYVAVAHVGDAAGGRDHAGLLVRPHPRRRESGAERFPADGGARQRFLGAARSHAPSAGGRRGPARQARAQPAAGDPLGGRRVCLRARLDPARCLAGDSGGDAHRDHRILGCRQDDGRRPDHWPLAAGGRGSVRRRRPVAARLTPAGGAR